MLGLSVFDSSGGLKSNFFPSEEQKSGSISLPQRMYLLDDSVVVLPPSDFELVVISREEINENILTWIGLCRSTPQISQERKGNYCGSGIWILNNSADGEDVLNLLRPRTSMLFNRLNTSKNGAWDITKTTARDFELDETHFKTIRKNEVPLGGQCGLGADLNLDICCVDLSYGDNTKLLATKISEVQTDRRYGNFRKAFLTEGQVIIEDLRIKGRAVFFDADKYPVPLPEDANNNMLPSSQLFKGSEVTQRLGSSNVYDGLSRDVAALDKSFKNIVKDIVSLKQSMSFVEKKLEDYPESKHLKKITSRSFILFVVNFICWSFFAAAGSLGFFKTENRERLVEEAVQKLELKMVKGATGDTRTQMPANSANIIPQTDPKISIPASSGNGAQISPDILEAQSYLENLNQMLADSEEKLKGLKGKSDSQMTKFLSDFNNSKSQISNQISNMNLKLNKIGMEKLSTGSQMPGTQ